jgi:hypothetical protein
VRKTPDTPWNRSSRLGSRHCADALSRYASPGKLGLRPALRACSIERGDYFAERGNR